MLTRIICFRSQIEISEIEIEGENSNWFHYLLAHFFKIGKVSFYIASVLSFLSPPCQRPTQRLKQTTRKNSGIIAKFNFQLMAGGGDSLYNVQLVAGGGGGGVAPGAPGAPPRGRGRGAGGPMTREVRCHLFSSSSLPL